MEFMLWVPWDFLELYELCERVAELFCFWVFVDCFLGVAPHAIF